MTGHTPKEKAVTALAVSLINTVDKAVPIVERKTAQQLSRVHLQAKKRGLGGSI